MSVPWRDEPAGSEPRLRANLEALVGELARSASARDLPSVDLARAWHRAIYDGIELPVAYYAGGIRDRDPAEPDLLDHEAGQDSRPDQRGWSSRCCCYVREVDHQARHGRGRAAGPRGL